MKRVPVIVFGLGGVGLSLLTQILKFGKAAAARAGCHFEITGLVDSRSWIFAVEGLNEGEISRAAVNKRGGGLVGERQPPGSDILSQFASACEDGGIVVDVTAADGMQALVSQALELGLGVVLANKKPLVSQFSYCRDFFSTPRLRYEATVGGGLPAVETIKTLLDSGDELLSVEGQMSGTMSMITRKMDENVPFSEALKAAVEYGVAEPDPREDIEGWDVMRKLVIIGRTAGWPLELDSIEVESLTPPSLAGVPLEEFMSLISELDVSIGPWARAASEAGMVLRYLARVEDGGGSVGLRAVPKGEPTASGKMMAIRTRRYDQQPLFIGSNTSGVETTAAAVISDMVKLVREW